MTKYSDGGLTHKTSLAGTEKWGISDSGVDKYITPADIKNYIGIGARIYRNSDQAIPDNTTTEISFNTEIYDTGNFWAIGSPTRLTIAVAGIYLVIAHFEWNNSTTTGTRSSVILLNGSAEIAVAGDGITTHTGRFDHHLQTLYQFAASDYITVQVYQNSGGSLDIWQNAAYSPIFCIHRVG